MSILAALVLMPLVMDPLGNVPVLLALLENVPPARRRWVLLRESVFALGFLLVFLYLGLYMLGMLAISQEALGIADGVVLFLIALRMIFPQPGGMFGPSLKGEPFVVPIAIPLIAGPSTLATVMLLATREPTRLPAWTAAAAGLVALEGLMGMILMTVAVQRLLSGIREFLAAI